VAAGEEVSMSIVDDLIAHPGLSLGIDEAAGTDRRGAARILVTPLPGRPAPGRLRHVWW
jgi:hypothetical protein